MLHKLQRLRSILIQIMYFLCTKTHLITKKGSEGAAHFPVLFRVGLFGGAQHDEEKAGVGLHLRDALKHERRLEADEAGDGLRQTVYLSDKDVGRLSSSWQLPGETLISL